MNFLSCIEAKRTGHALSPKQVRAVIAEYTAGNIADYQMSAFLMAICCRGMNPDEITALTLAMRDSGKVLKFPEDDRPIVDKHSTGGVGDKVSIALAPLLACLGFRVPMISGRGLGITGGTLDKLESIPGFTTQLTNEQIVSQVQRIGVALGGQTSEIAPADKALYALRDVTGTVTSIPLITASILSKKLAENIDALVMDVKFGKAAFMKDQEQAHGLAQSIVQLASECGVRTSALLTRMDTPLGRTAGNWLEVKEAVACLDCRGPEDLEELVSTCAAELLIQSGKSSNKTEAKQLAQEEMVSGRPRKKFDELLAAQGADLQSFNDKMTQDVTAPVVREFTTSAEGFITKCDAELVGQIVRDLGGGRLIKDSVIQPDVGIDQLIKLGEAFGRGSTLARVHSMNEENADFACNRLSSAFEHADEPLPQPQLILQVI